MNTDSLFDLGGRVAIVTGGGDGIGRACCRILAAAGASVVVGDRSADKARQTVSLIESDGGKATAVECDVLKDDRLDALVKTAVDSYGTVNILVNNAGFGGGGRENPFATDADYLVRVYSVNVFAPWKLCRLVVPYMVESGYGSIVNITSMSSVDKEAAMSIYSSSKAALNHMAANLAYDFGPMGVRVNCVGPGATRTAALASILTPEMEERMLRHTPLQRLGEVDDVARGVVPCLACSIVDKRAGDFCKRRRAADARLNTIQMLNIWQVAPLFVPLQCRNPMGSGIVERFGCLQPLEKMLKL